MDAVGKVPLELIDYVSKQMQALRFNTRSLGRVAGVSHMTIYTLLQGTKRPSPETLTLIAPHLGTTGDHLKSLGGYIDQPRTMSDDVREIFEMIDSALPLLSPLERSTAMGMLRGMATQLEAQTKKKKR
jgi:transcriptional regulator with XRE-family HTH domain